ncbi:hypothetical protein [Streptomyces sparsogenes]|nr:hypothetical protein [Streptomyces sparsogenes]
MTTVSAIPEYLARYSDVCTQGAEQLQTWVRTVLTPSLLAYENGGGPCVAEAIDANVARQVAAAYYTDRDVRTVGQAFLRAGGVLVRGRNQPIRADGKAVETFVQMLRKEAAHQAQIKAGAALAHELPTVMNAGERQRVERELAKHADDPYFCAGFFNSLNVRQIEQFLAQPGNIQPLVSAYASGVLTEATTGHVVEALSRLVGRDNSVEHNHITPEQQIALLNALRSNPTAALNFANSLSAAQIRHLFYGEASLNPPLRSTLLAVLTTAMGNVDGQPRAHALMHKVSQALFGEGAPKLTHNEMKPLIGPLMQFYAAGVTQSQTPPPGADPIALRRWAEGLGRQTGQGLGLFLKAANETGDEHELLKSMIQGGYVNVLFMPTAVLAPEALIGNIAYTAGVGAAQSLFSSEMDPLTGLLDKLFPGGSHANTSLLNDRLAVGGLSLTVSSLISRGLVHPAGSNTPVSFGADPVKNAELVKKIMLHPDEYYAGKKDAQGHEPPSITDLTHAYRDLELGEISKALGDPDYEQPD